MSKNKSGKKLISIIIPVYNGENYLEKCVNSCLVQSYPNFEVIVVDDGSSDSSLEIVYNLASNNDKLKVYTINNSGPSFARNFGFYKSKGDFIFFLDADDFLDHKCLEILMGCSELTNCDLTLGQSITLSENNKVGRTNFSSTNNSLNDFLNGFLPYTMWPILFSRDILSKVSLNNSLKSGEDYYILSMIYSNKPSVHVSNELLHYYNRNPYSITANMTSEKLKDNYNSFNMSLMYFFENARVDDALLNLIFIKTIKYYIHLLKINSPYAFCVLRDVCNYKMATRNSPLIFYFIFIICKKFPLLPRLFSICYIYLKNKSRKFIPFLTNIPKLIF